jgi:hypothetical protein
MTIEDLHRQLRHYTEIVSMNRMSYKKTDRKVYAKINELKHQIGLFEETKKQDQK